MAGRRQATGSQVSRAARVPPPTHQPQVPLVKLDDAHYKLVDKLERLTKAAPSLRLCSSLTVKGPVRFGAGVVIK